MEKVNYYVLTDSTWGKRPLVNLNRCDCDTYFRVKEGVLVGGFVYCRYSEAIATMPSGTDAEKFLKENLNSAMEITRGEYLEYLNESMDL